MALIKKGKTYWLDIRIKGKRVRRSLRTTNRLKALSEYGKKKDELLAEYNQERVKFSTFCEQYLKWAWSAKPKSTVREEQRLYKIIQFFVGLDAIYLSDITPYHIEQLKAWLKENGRSKSTINGYLQLLRGLFNRAIDWEVYKSANPLKKVKFFRGDSQIRSLSPQELRSLLKTAKGISQNPKSPLQRDFYALCLLSLNTGMRRGEILNLKWRDIKGEEVVIKGKGDKMRVIPLNAIALKILQKQAQKNEYVFNIPNRNAVSVFTRTTQRIKRETGISFHFHLLRHAFATRLIENGVDIITISKLLGHSKYMISLIYSHTSAERMKAAVHLLEKG